MEKTSIVVFGALNVASIVLLWIPLIGGFFASLIGLLSIILWIVLMVKSYQGTRYKLPWSGNMAERWVG